MKVIIAGSRTITDPTHIQYAVTKFENITQNEITEVISGTAIGADSLGEAWALAHDIHLVRMPAEWSKYGKSAGYRRNDEMAQITDGTIVIWDGFSRGSQHMIQISRGLNLPTLVFNTATGDASFSK